MELVVMKVEDIPPPLSVATLKHRRNVMTTAGVVLVIAWVPLWDLQSFAPLGFKIDATVALLIWGVIAYHYSTVGLNDAAVTAFRHNVLEFTEQLG